MRLGSQRISRPAHQLSEARQHALFAAVAMARREGLSVPAARAIVSVRFHVSLQAVAEIEHGGLAGGWSVTGIPTHPAEAA